MRHVCYVVYNDAACDEINNLFPNADGMFNVFNRLMNADVIWDITFRLDSFSVTAQVCVDRKCKVGVATKKT